MASPELGGASSSRPAASAAGRVVQRVAAVLVPKGEHKESAAAALGYDLWVPLGVSAALAASATHNLAPPRDAALAFAAVFALAWAGAAACAATCVLLGGAAPFLPSLATLLYAVLPLALASLASHVSSTPLTRFALAVTALAWSLTAALPLVAGAVPPARRPLAAAPVSVVLGLLALVVYTAP